MRVEEVVAELNGQGYGALKKRATEAIIKTVAPIREKYINLISNKEELLKLARIGAERASQVAKETLLRAKTAVGLW